MDIAPYITELLRQHDEVNVPTLGTFYKKHKSGYFNADKGNYYPPSYGLGFKKAEDNPLLTSFISHQKNISVNTANYFIEKFVSGVQALLAENGRAEIPSFGTLVKSNEGYAFIDVLTFDDKGQYFGLQPVTEIPVTEHAETSPVNQDSPGEVRTDTGGPALAEQTPEEDHALATTADNKGRWAGGKILIVAASIIMVSIIAYLVYPQAFEVFRQETNVPEKKVPAKQPAPATAPATFADSLAQADTIYQELARQGFDVEKPKDTLDVTTEVSTPAPPTDAVTFEIIGAAFARRTEAETYVKQLNARGVYAKIVENMPGSKLKISLGSFNDEALASKELTRIKKEFNKEAWIARVKPKKTN